MSIQDIITDEGLKNLLAKIRRKYYSERIQKNELGFLKEIKKEGL